MHDGEDEEVAAPANGSTNTVTDKPKWVSFFIDEEGKLRPGVPVSVTATLALVPALIGAVKMLIFSRSDPTILKTIVANVDISTVYTGALMDTLPILLIAGGVFLCENAVRLPALTPIDPVKAVAVYVVGVAGLIMAFLGIVFIPWIYIATAIVVAVVVFLRFLFANRDAKDALRKAGRLISGNVFAVQVGVLLIVLLLSGGAWLPRENFTIGSNPRTSGYVLAASVAGVTIYTVKPLSVKTVRVADLARETCAPPRGVVDKSIIGLIGAEVMLPVCV